MRISDWSSDVCPSDLGDAGQGDQVHRALQGAGLACSASAEPGEEAGQDRTGGATPVQPVRAVRIPRAPALRRSEERRVGKECASTCRSRCSQLHNKKNTVSHTSSIDNDPTNSL